MFRRVVNVVQIVALVAAAFFVVMLFAYRPSSSSYVPPTGNPVLDAGRRVFAGNCARCHGTAGEGGIGPQLAGRVRVHFATPEDEIAVVRDGRGSMPSFAGALSDEEIRDVVEYTRSL